jgi:hypothetical protein
VAGSVAFGPGCHTIVEFVVVEPKCDERINVEQIRHGKLVRISLTSLPRNTGASAPALRTGSLVTVSVIIRTRRRRLLRGVRTILPALIFASSGSPACMPSLRRNGPGRTTWPLAETLVCTVRQSYPFFRLAPRNQRSRKDTGQSFDLFRTENCRLTTVNL